MAWPFLETLRGYLRLVSHYLGGGYTEPEILQHTAESPAHYDLNLVREAMPEARRAEYFMDRIQSAYDRLEQGGRNATLGQLWFTASRGAWYAGYGRAPTDAERAWAYSRPQEVLGMTFFVTGTGAWSGRPVEFSVTVNASWNLRIDDLYAQVAGLVTSGEIISGDLGSEPIDPDTIELSLQNGALLARQQTTGQEPGQPGRILVPTPR